MNDAVVTAVAALVVVLLTGLTGLVARLFRKAGIETKQKEHQLLQATVEEGILMARQVCREREPGQKTNELMHATAVDHVRSKAGGLVTKLARSQVDDLIYAGVRKLKRLL